MQTKYPFITSTNDLQETMLMLGVIVTKKCSLNLVCNESEVWGILKSITPCTPHYPNVKLITHSCSARDVRTFLKSSRHPANVFALVNQ